jgi:hypothetical protein
MFAELVFRATTPAKRHGNVSISKTDWTSCGATLRLMRRNHVFLRAQTQRTGPRSICGAERDSVKKLGLDADGARSRSSTTKREYFAEQDLDFHGLQTYVANRATIAYVTRHRVSAE